MEYKYYSAKVMYAFYMHHMVTLLETVGGGTKMITMVMVVTRVLMWLRMALIPTGTMIQVLQTISQVIEAS